MCKVGWKKSKNEGQTCNFKEKTLSSPLKLRQKRERGCSRWKKQKWRFSSVRRSSFSLRSREIGPLDFDEAIREFVLLGEDNA